MRSGIISIFIFFLALAVTPYAIYGIDFPPSQSPPGGLQPSQVPQFVVFGFDDQLEPSAFRWVFKLFSSKTNPAGNGQDATYDGTQTTASFYTNTKNGTQYHLEAYNEGHEIGNHTHSHPDGGSFSVAAWESEMNTCTGQLTAAGIPRSAIAGFRCPFLIYNDNAFTAMRNCDFVYDCSIEEGYEEDQDGTNYYWPYTLDNGSPGNRVLFELFGENELLASHPGLWAMPAYYLIIPQEYRAQVERNDIDDVFDETNGKLTGLDWNLFDYAMFSPDQFAETLKHNLDLRYTGNRAPLHFGCHSVYYGEADKQNALIEVLEYALAKPDVRVVSQIKVLEWMLDPVPLRDITETKPARSDAVSQLCIRALTEHGLYCTAPQQSTCDISLFLVDGRRITALYGQVVRAGETVIHFNNVSLLPRTVYLVRISGKYNSAQKRVVVF